jgi:hypothetical protein
MILNRGLEPLRSTPSFPFATWDVEAAEWWNLKLIGCFDGEYYYHFRDVPSFLFHILQHKYRGFRFFAHFGGRYDLNFIFDYLRNERHDIDVSFYCSGAMVVQMTLRCRGITVKLCDSYRLLQASLRDLGIAFDVRHKKTEVDFSTIDYNKELIEYNEQDCRCLYEVITRFFAETGIHSETFATHALRYWRKDFLKQTIWKPPENVLEAARSAYHGGRVEVFKRESANIHAYDVNSMYPYVMRLPMPVEYAGIRLKLLSKDFGFIEATVFVPETYIPCLPVRLEKLYFPTGTLRKFWTSEELIAAEIKGVRIQKIHHGYYFKTVDIFAGYIETLYALKKKSGEPTRTIAKLLMNALYGKFGQNPTKKVYIMEHSAPDGSTPLLTPTGMPTGYAWYERTSQNAYLLPHLAAAVTSKARLHLFSNLSEAVYYCDTDSIFTSEIIPTSNELGAWAEVGSGAATFYQPKLYKFSGKWKAKGLNRQESIDDFVSGGVNHVLRARSIKESLRDDLPACEHVSIEKQLRESRPKREWVGNDTRPWNLEEIL